VRGDLLPVLRTIVESVTDRTRAPRHPKIPIDDLEIVGRQNEPDGRSLLGLPTSQEQE
jgi:hypothetical protein